MGGMETYCHRLTEELAKAGDVEIIALPGQHDGSPPSALALLKFPFTILRRWLGRRRPPPDILHIADMALWPVGLLKSGRTRVVLSAHGTDVSYPRRGGFKGRLYGAYLRLGSKFLRGAHVIANSAATQMAARESGWQRTHIVPLATDIAGAAPTQPPRRSVLFAGRLVRQKGLSWFVENVLDALPADITLEVAGTRWDSHEDAALAHPRVTYLGRLAPRDLAKAYSNALCVILPNIERPNGEFEGFGLIACEAAAAGGIVLAADCGGLRESVIDGETGLLVPPGKPDAWRSAITAVSNWNIADRTRFAHNAISRCGSHFSWDRVAKDTLKIYKTARMPVVTS